MNDAGAEYLVVDAYVLTAYGPARSTGDFDIWVRATKQNADRVWNGAGNFPAPRRNLSLGDLSTPDVVLQIGVAPNRIDILTSIDGVDFDEAWQHRKQLTIEGAQFPVIGREQLLKNKRATGRPKDLADVAWLEAADEQSS